MHDPLEINIRQATECDHAEILEITSEVFGPTTYEKNLEDNYGLIAGKSWEWRKARHLQIDLKQSNGECYVAVLEAKVRGYVTILLDYDSKIGVISNLAVAKNASNQGIGRRLLQDANQVMRKAGMEIARIETLEQNSIGKHLYPQVGFRKFATQHYFALDLRDGTA
jgi:ribosomal protein S18 acetylase RimI-like enzyme